MRVMIVGHGYVGSAVSSIFTDDEKVIIDPKLNDNKISDYAGNRFMAVFVCVDTPKGDNTTVLNQVLNELDTHIKDDTPVCCKSTSTPEYYGWAEEQYSNIKVLHSPEYLDSKNNIEKFQKQTFCIVGGDKIAAQIVTSIFCTRLKYLDCKNTHVTDIRTAALSSKRIELPVSLRIVALVRTTTALTTSDFLTPIFGIASLTEATITSPTWAYRRLEPKTLIHCKRLAPLLSATVKNVSC